MDKDTTPAADEKNTVTAPGTTENPQGQTSGTEQQEMSIEDYKSALSSARKEAAKYRTERNELRPLAEKYREAEQANKTDAERAAERIAALEAENKNIILTYAREQAAAKLGVEPDLIKGDTPEEIETNANALGEFIKAHVEKALKQHMPFAPTVPGENAGSAPLSEGDWLRKMFTQK